MKFHLKADCSFQAKNVEHALGILSDHFLTTMIRMQLDRDLDKPSPLDEAEMRGSIELQPFNNPDA